MKEETVNRIDLIKIFLRQILFLTIIMFIGGSLIIYVVKSWRFNPVIYIICFFICLGISCFNFFRKPEVKNEFKGNQ